jgi:hypothetical protein
MYFECFQQDVNDNRPTFKTDVFDISVAENLPKDSQILPLNAVDLDRGRNGRLLYQMVGEESAVVGEYLGLLPNSGIVYLKKELDYEKVQSLEFDVQEWILCHIRYLVENCWIS